MNHQSLEVISACITRNIWKTGEPSLELDMDWYDIVATEYSK